MKSSSSPARLTGTIMLDGITFTCQRDDQRMPEQLDSINRGVAVQVRRADSAHRFSAFLVMIAGERRALLSGVIGARAVEQC